MVSRMYFEITYAISGLFTSSPMSDETRRTSTPRFRRLQTTNGDWKGGDFTYMYPIWLLLGEACERRLDSKSHTCDLHSVFRHRVIAERGLVDTISIDVAAAWEHCS
jgi:hypothetical protein